MPLLDVLVCHAPADLRAASDLAQRLERNGEARVRLLSTDDTTIAEAWTEGDTAKAVILLMTPGAVPPKPTRETWKSLLEHVEGRGDPQIAVVVLRDCAFPKLLERAACFRRGLDTADLRALDEWHIGLHESVHTFRAAPAIPPAGHERELEHVIDGSGTHELGGADPSRLAQAFARQFAGHYLDVLWIECGLRDLSCLAGEVAARLGIQPDGSLDDAWRQIAAVLHEHRILVVFDDLREQIPTLASAAGRGTVLITRPAAVLTTGPSDGFVWQELSACREQGFSLAFAARLAGVSESEVAAQCEPLDAGLRRYRRTATSGTVTSAIRARHAELLSEIFLHRGDSLSDECVPELDAALDWAISEDWPLAVQLAKRANLFFQDRGRRFEAVHYLRRVAAEAEHRGDAEVVHLCRKDLSWLTDDMGAVHHHWIPGQQGTLF